MKGLMEVEQESQISAARKLELLIQFHRKALLLRDQDKFAALISLEVANILEAERATIFMIDQQRQELYAKFATGLSPEQMKHLRFAVGRGITGRVAQTGELINVSDAQAHPDFNPDFDRLTHFSTRSVLAAPMKDFSGRVMGVLAAFNKTNSRVFDKNDEGIMELLASQLAATYEILELLESLRLAGYESIYALAQTAEYRDQEDTGPHLHRMSLYSAMLAEAIGLDPRTVEIIKLTSPLHDIGKVAIPDQILKKPGRFTPEEFEEMKKHTLYGYEMLKDFKSPLLKAASRIALAHHERYDGSGYPNKLKGDQIPLEARIVTLADSLDAMTSRRVYKEPISFEQAYLEINRCAGTQFDPMVVDAFNRKKVHFEALIRNRVDLVHKS